MQDLPRPVEAKFVLDAGDIVIAMTELKQDAPILGAAGRVPSNAGEFRGWVHHVTSGWSVWLPGERGVVCGGAVVWVDGVRASAGVGVACAGVIADEDRAGVGGVAHESGPVCECVWWGASAGAAPGGGVFGGG